MKAVIGFGIALLLCCASATFSFAQAPCECPTLPPLDEADFQMGTPVFTAPDSFAVSLIVNTAEDVTFTQMTFNYDNSILMYVSTSVGNDVINPGLIFEDNAQDSGSNYRLLLNLTGQYTGCSQEVFVVRFRLIDPPPGNLVWDQTLGGPNSNCHLNYDKTSGGDGKILPDDIEFCDGVICEPNLTVAGTVTYYSNAEPILDNVPDNPTSVPVTVEDCSTAPSTTASAPLGAYSLPFGLGPKSIMLCASRPMAVCGTNEDGVISGDDVIMLQDTLAVSPLGFANPKQQLAADVDKNNLVTLTDVLLVKRWIGRLVCNAIDSCGGFNNNCAATWRFLYLTGNGPNGYDVDTADLGDVCVSRAIHIQGVLVGDVDGSWPDLFLPKSSSGIALQLSQSELDNGEVRVGLQTVLEAGESLRHVIYSLDYDSAEFEYLGIELGTGAKDWGALDNPAETGVAHGIVHRPANVTGMTQSGEVVAFRFRALRENASSQISFSRLKANDVDVDRPELEIHGDGDSSTITAPPTHYSVSSHPNPFNPRTRIEYTIPDGAGRVPVSLNIYDISGRLVRSLESVERGPGRYGVTWDGTDNVGDTSGTGIYMLHVRAGEWISVEKLTLIK